MIEIQNLAVVIRDTAALDTDGIVAAQMASDLSDTNPRVMQAAFALARRRFNWLPRTAQLLGLYEEALMEHINDHAKQAQRKTLLETDRLAEDRRLNPENYTTFGGIVLATPGCDEHVLSLQRQAGLKESIKAADENRAMVQHCPFCECALPMRVADLTNLTIPDLQAIIDAKHRHQQFVAEGRAAGDAQIAAAAKPETKRRKKVTA